MKKKLKIILIILVLIVGGTIGYGVYYFNDYYKAKDNAIELVNESNVVKEDDYIVFECEEPKAGIIFYPGAKVQCEAYAPLMESLSNQGILCILIDMPANFSLFDINAAKGIQEKYPEVTNWYMAGHSLGGVCAGYYIAKHTDAFKGLILLASYSSKDLSDTDLKVLCIYGSNDGVLNRKNYKKSLSNLPDDYQEVIIEGGNHANFGDYGKQSGDGTATITKEEQVDITTKAIINLIQSN